MSDMDRDIRPLEELPLYEKDDQAGAQDRPMSGFTAHETLELLLGDFKWLLEQHPEHDGTYARERIEQVEAVLRGD